MKTIILNSESGQQDILKYGSQLFQQLKQESNVIVADKILPDFSNVPDLFDNAEKLLLFNQFSSKEGFKALSTYLPTFKNVKYLLSLYSSYSGLDLEVVKKLDIRYRNNGGANAKSVAQYAITCMFVLLTKFPILSRLKSIPDGSVLGEEYHQKTVGIIGMGNVGQEIAKTLSGLGVHVVYYNRTQKDVGAERVSLENIFKQDIIFISIASNPETVDLLSKIPNFTQKQITS